MWSEVPPTAAAALGQRGFWVQDGAVEDKLATELREEILRCHEDGLLTQSGNKLAVRLANGQRGGRVCKKPHVFEADLIVDGKMNCPEVLQQSPVLAGLLAQEGQLRKSFNNLGFLQIDRLEQAKVQVNVGKGGAFPCHFDLPSSLSAKRLLTVLLYLNPEWTEGDGGEVELFPFPFQDAILEPLHQRLVAFSSCTSLHRVRPFVGNPGRVCLNLWFEGKVLSDHSSFPLPDLDVADSYDPRACKIVRILRQRPAELRAFCKVWYSDTMVQSLRDAFEESEDLEAAIELHMEEMTEIESRIATATIQLLQECLPFKMQDKEVAEDLEAAELVDLFDGL